MEWLAIGLPHNGSHLFARLPFDDAIRLAALVGTGRLTWTEIHAALDAKIKLAIARQRARSGDGFASCDPHEAWEAAQRTGEDDIWARYHARCDAIFAADSTADGIERWSREHIRNNEHVLNRLRNERDRALAALSRRLATRQLAIAERDALRKLDDSGFIGSQAMADAILELATPLAGIIERSA
jgi:hypothetical protein